MVPEDIEKYDECARVFKIFSLGKVAPYISSIVLLELNYVLLRIYKFKRTEIVDALEKLTKIRNMKLIEKTDSLNALSFYKSMNIKLGDCFIATQIPDGATMVTYDDKHFKKFKDLKVMTPKKFLLELRKKP